MAKGQKSLWTTANVVTCVRVALVPVWLAIAETARATLLPGASWATLILYVVIALTDKLDGYLARSREEVTTFGKFLDPIADKLAVIVALIFLLECGRVVSGFVLVVIARELLVDGLRMVMSSKGTVIAASSLGKWKTATTMVALCMLLVGVVIDAGLPSAWLASVFALVVRGGEFVLLIAVALTIWSGVDYFVKCWPTMRDAA